MAGLKADSRVSRTHLSRAIEQAIIDGRSEADALRSRVDAALKTLQDAAGELPSTEDANDPVWQFKQFSQEATSDLDRVFQRQVEALGEFNIVFFGRTGAGKSSLLSAFGELDGHLVSQGESDWTTDLASLQWHGARLIDTPGIDGWGRTQARSTLESRARAAVETADIVVLCFDDQSQQVSEFKKIAAWVRDYGKPVLAVLNVRNSRWRQPALTTEPNHRKGLSQTVREHATHIEQSLDSIGIGPIPIIAINSRRALDALARAPYRGPDRDGMEHRRHTYGRDNLLAWSNFPLLDDIISASLEVGATDFRTAALRDGVSSSIRSWMVELTTMREAAKASATHVEQTIQTTLQVLGYPDRQQRGQLGPAGTDLLRDSERLRGRPYGATGHGELETHAGRLFAAHLAPLHTKSLAAAEEAIWDSFKSRRALTEEAFRKRVFDEKAIESAAKRVYQRATRFAQEKIALAAEDGVVDVQFSADGISVDGRIGDWQRHASTAARVSGLLTGAAGALGTFALANIWNPAGWSTGVAAAVMAVGAIASAVFGWVARRLGRKAEDKRTRERSRALGEARRSVNDAYDSLSDRLTQAIQTDAWLQASPHVSGLLRSAIGLRQVEAQSQRSRKRLQRVAKSVAPPPDPAAVLSRAIDRVRDERSFEGPSTALLRGEDWIEDLTVHQPPVLVDGDHGLQTGLDLAGIWARPPADQVRAWRRKIARAATKWPGVVPARQAADEALRTSPLIALVGDYSAGKSSLIKRLLVDSGVRPPAELLVDAAPATDQPREYRWLDYRLVDTPGFQSGRHGHDERALKAAADAFLVVVVLNNNGLVGDPVLLDEMLSGSERIPSKLARAVFLMNRSDGLITDPGESPREFRRIRMHKSEELRRALASHGSQVDASRIWCIASDPFGLMGNNATSSPQDFDAFRMWDGIEQVVQPLRDASRSQRSGASAVTAVDSALARLMERRMTTRTAATDLEDKRSALQQLERTVGEARRVAHAHEKALRAEADRICQRNAHACLTDTLNAATDEARRAEAKRLQRWWKDPGFVAEVERYQGRAKRDIDRWLSQYSAALDRQLNSGSFVRAYPDFHTDTELATSGGSTLKEAAGVLGKVGKFAGYADRSMVYKAGKAIGYKFRPWEAVNTASKLNKAGGYLAAAGVVLDGVIWAKDARDAHKREQAQAQARDFVNLSVPGISERLSGDLDGRGPVGYLRQATENLEAIRKQLQSERNKIEFDLKSINAELTAVEALISEGLDLSNRAEPGDDHE